MRLVDADELAEGIADMRITITGLRAGKCALTDFAQKYRESVLQIIDDAPTIEAEPVKHGRWEPHYEVVDGEIRISASKRVCSVCKDIWESSRILPHCPGCGAKMDGGEEE